MDALIMDKDFKSVAIIDDYESFIWTDRYCGYGDYLEPGTIGRPDYC